MSATPSTAELIEAEKHRRSNGAFVFEDTGENWDPPIPTAAEVAWRHGKWQEKRDRMRDAIARIDNTHKRLERWDSCGACAVVEHSKELDVCRITCWHCRDRMCEPCQAKRAKEVARIVRSNAKGKTLRFMTLSCRSTEDPLKDQIRFLRKSFNKLKRTPIWKSSVIGGCAILEVKREPKAWKERADGSKYQTSGLWHPHLHMMTTGTWIDANAVRDAWEKITGGSRGFDVRVVDREESACNYIAKYVNKATNAAVVCNPEWLVEFIQAMRGSRTYNVFGKWVGVKRDADEQQATDWKAITTVHDLMIARNAEEPWAIALANRLKWKPADLPASQQPQSVDDSS